MATMYALNVYTHRLNGVCPRIVGKKMKKEAYQNKIEKIISEMTVEEKVAQMQQLSESVTPVEVFQGFKKSGVIGSYLHVLGNETGEYLQYAESSRLQIPPIFGIDAIHGHALLKQATVFPSQLAMAC